MVIVKNILIADIFIDWRGFSNSLTIYDCPEGKEGESLSIMEQFFMI